VTTDVHNCARCGGDHAGLTFLPFTRPPPGATHFAPCPANGEPVLMACEVGDPPAENDGEPIGWLGLSHGTVRKLRRVGIETVETLLHRSAGDLLGIPRFGRVSLFEIRQTLLKRNLCLRGDYPGRPPQEQQPCP
jgi:DNA-directed RNA polymerase alpha subunit